MGTQKVVNTDTKLVSLGLGAPSGEALEPEVDQETAEQTEESEESTGDALNALSGEVEDTDESEEEEETEEEEEDEEERPETDSADDEQSQLKKERDAAEAQMREWQSRYDKSQADLQQLGKDYQSLYNEIQTMKETASNEAVADIEDDDILDVRTFKKMMQHYQATSQAAPTHAQPNVATDQQAAEAQWVQSQPDVKEVQAYVNEHMADLKADPSLPQSTQALYFAVKERMAREDLEKTRNTFEKEKKKMIRSKGRPKAPPTGGVGSRKTSGSRLTDIEAQMESHMRKLGLSA